jgi:hypothetical protein
MSRSLRPSGRPSPRRYPTAHRRRGLRPSSTARRARPRRAPVAGEVELRGRGYSERARLGLAASLSRLAAMAGSQGLRRGLPPRWRRPPTIAARWRPRAGCQMLLMPGRYGFISVPPPRPGGRCPRALPSDAPGSGAWPVAVTQVGVRGTPRANNFSGRSSCWPDRRAVLRAGVILKRRLPGLGQAVGQVPAIRTVATYPGIRPDATCASITCHTPSRPAIRLLQVLKTL